MKKQLPPIGARIMKSSIAVALCMIVYFVRTFLPIGNGIPFYGALAALWCMQQYNDTTKTNAVQRSVGTLIGAVYGLVFLLLFRLINVTVPMIVYIMVSSGTMLKWSFLSLADSLYTEIISVQNTAEEMIRNVCCI